MGADLDAAVQAANQWPAESGSHCSQIAGRDSFRQSQERSLCPWSSYGSWEILEQLKIPLSAHVK